MQPLVAPLAAPSKPSTAEFEAAVISGTAMANTGSNIPPIQTTYTVEKDTLVIRLPLVVAFADVRKKSEVNNEGKLTQSVTAVFSCTPEKQPPTMRMTNAPLRGADGVVTGYARVNMPLKPTINLNIGLDWRKRTVEPEPAK